MKRPTDLPTFAALLLSATLPPIAALLSRRLLGKGHHAIRHEAPPRNPANPDVPWRDALVWSIITGAVGGLARLTVRRSLAGAAASVRRAGTCRPVERAAEALRSAVDAAP